MTQASSTALAREFGISARAVRYCLEQGMPRDLAGAAQWREDRRLATVELRSHTHKAKPERFCKCGSGPLPKRARLCDACRWPERDPASERIYAIPSWVSRARDLYEGGLKSSGVAKECRVSLASVNSWMRRQQWDRGKHRINSDPDQQLDLPALRVAYEAGLDPVGMAETSFRNLAKRQGWDSTKRWEAIWTLRREGLDKESRRKLRQKVNKHARRAGADGTLTTATLAKMRSDLLCPYCGHRLTEENRSLDHIDPVDAGGPTSFANSVECCRTCNTSKGKRPLLIWLAIRAARKIA